MKVPLVERFVSIQGEGSNAGWPAYFIRYAGCNLDCQFADGSICDTPWRKAREHVPIEKVAAEAHSALSGMAGSGWVIVTGGEPCIQPTLPALLDALMDLGLGAAIAIESNATRWFSQLSEVAHLVASPKHLIPHGTGATLDSLPNSMYLKHAHELRLVVTGDTDPQAFRSFDRPKFVSPATISDGSGAIGFDGFSEGAVERALLMVQRYGWRLSLQLHKFLNLR